MKSRIDIEIKSDGTIFTDATNFEGNTCIDAVSILMKDLASVIDGENKPESWDQKRIETESTEVKNILNQ